MPKNKLTQRIDNVIQSKSVQMASVILELRNNAEEIISFNVGEPDFAADKRVIEATKKALDDGHTRYALVPGERFLREEIANQLNKRQNLNINASNICVSNGSKQVLYSIFQLLCETGDEVLVPCPYWVSFPEAIKLAGATPVLCPSKDGDIDIDAIKNSITNKTCALILNTPNNPSGQAYTKDQVSELMAIAREHDLWVISDEAYEALIYDNNEFNSPAKIGDKNLDRTLIVQSFSKSYCMTGFRLGYVAANTEFIQAMIKLQSHVCGNMPVFAQYGALKALEIADELRNHMITTFEQRRDIAYELCKEIFEHTKKPSGAFYLFPKIQKSLLDRFDNDEALAMYILKEAKVATLPGSYFGCPNHLRICFSTSTEEIRNGFTAIKELLCN